MIMDFKLSIDTEKGTFDIVNMSTGEIKTVDVPKTRKASTSTKKVVDNNPNPQLTLEDSKYLFNSAAVELMGIEPEDRIDIKYEKNGKAVIPVIGTNTAFGTKAGNRLTKSFTVSCRGKANDELRIYGTIFDIIPHPEKEGLFILKGDNSNVEIPEETSSEVEINEEEVNIDLDINDFLDDSNTSEDISALDFQL